MPASSFTFLGVSSVMPTTVTRTKTYWQQSAAALAPASTFTPGATAGIALACIAVLVACTVVLWCRWRARRRAAAKVKPVRGKKKKQEEEEEEKEEEEEDSYEEVDVDAYSVGKRSLQLSLRKSPRERQVEEEEGEDAKPLKIRSGRRSQGGYTSPSSPHSSREVTGDSYFSSKSPTDPKGGVGGGDRDGDEGEYGYEYGGDVRRPRLSSRAFQGASSPPKAVPLGMGAKRSASVPKRLPRVRPFKGQAWMEDSSDVEGAKAAAILQRSQNLVAKSRNVALDRGGHLGPSPGGSTPLRPRMALKSAGAATLIQQQKQLQQQQQQRRAPNLKGLNLGEERGDGNGNSSPLSPKQRTPKGASPSPYGRG